MSRKKLEFNMFFGIRKQKISSIEHEKGEKILWDFLLQKHGNIINVFYIILASIKLLFLNRKTVGRKVQFHNIR